MSELWATIILTDSRLAPNSWPEGTRAVCASLHDVIDDEPSIRRHLDALAFSVARTVIDGTDE